MEKITIKQIAHPDNPQLSAKYIGAKEYLTPKTGRDGKVITGVDENAYAVINPEDDTVNVKDLSKKIQKEREELERLLNMDLTPSSDIWAKFYIVLEDERILDSTNPLDRLHEKFLVANRYVAPSFEAIEENPDYFNCMFYLHRDKEETSKKATISRKLDKAVSKLLELSDKEPLKLQQVSGHIFGYEAHEITVDDAYVKIREFLENEDPKTQKKNIEMFLDVANKSQTEITTKKILDAAIKKRYVTSKGNVFRRGEEIYGNNYEEALEFLLDSANSAELISLEKQVKKGNN